VLQYLDLKLVEKILEFNITNAMMGDLLFPHKFDNAETTERVIKVVKTLAKVLKDNVFIDALEYAASN
jgi:hypothetical protein